MVLVLGMFAAPLLLAWLALSVFPDWQPKNSTNYGDLVQPVRPLPAFELVTAEGKSIDETFLRGKWTILYLAEGACDRPCVDQLYNIRQIRLAQGKNIDRLQRLMLWSEKGVSDGMRQELKAHFPGQLIAPVKGDEPLLQAFILDEQDPISARRVYLIDPLGNLMIRYEPDMAPKGMIKDLEKLLKYSGLG
jgi:cytochrome oxidase Cu insertion factor (SCO1/SenC/PrrC family)